MAEAVYVLCTATSVVSAVLLFTAFQRSGLRLLLWSGLCFAGLALNNAIVFLDLVIFPDLDLALVRGTIGLLAVAVLVFGLVWETS